MSHRSPARCALPRVHKVAAAVPVSLPEIQRSAALADMAHSAPWLQSNYQPEMHCLPLPTVTPIHPTYRVSTPQLAAVTSGKQLPCLWHTYCDSPCVHKVAAAVPVSLPEMQRSAALADMAHSPVSNAASWCAVWRLPVWRGAPGKPLAYHFEGFRGTPVSDSSSSSSSSSSMPYVCETQALSKAGWPIVQKPAWTSVPQW
jgi:hypothetical protein